MVSPYVKRESDKLTAAGYSADLAETKARRNRVNAPWPRYRGNVNSAGDLESDPEYFAYLERLLIREESGARFMVRCALPTIGDHPGRRAALEADLCKYFGGYIRFELVGGWVSGEGKVMHEPGYLYEVAGRTGRRDVDHARALFCKAGMDIGEEWVHIEVHAFTAAHAQVN